VPHPEHLQMQMMAVSCQDGFKCMMVCTACNADYWRMNTLSSTNNQAFEEMPIMEGKKWCYSGYHTIKALPEDEQRRVFKNDVVILNMGPTLQDKIEALHGNENVRIIKLMGGGRIGAYSEDPVSFADILLPNLEEFHCDGVNLGRLTLTKDLTPNLQVLSMENPTMSDDPQFTIECPTLKAVSINYCSSGHFGWLLQLLETATELEEFSSYKLSFVGYLKFASNQLRSITIHRADCLSALHLWAPKLELLDVQSCYDLFDIHFLSRHPLLGQQLSPQFQHGMPLVVRAGNTSLGKRTIEEISNHPRVSEATAKRLADQAKAWESGVM